MDTRETKTEPRVCPKCKALTGINRDIMQGRHNMFIWFRITILSAHPPLYEGASLDLFIRFTEGNLTFDEEQMSNTLGVKF